MGQGQNVSFSFSNDKLGRNTEGRAGKHSAKERKRAGAIKEWAATRYNILTSSLRTPKFFVKEFCYFLMSCHQHCLGVNPCSEAA